MRNVRTELMWVKTNRITSVATIGMLRSVFARLGMPELLVSDNGTQFTSAEFLEFCTTNGIQHLTTAPFHPQSNGQAERFVDTFKRAVKKIQAGRSSIDEALDDVSNYTESSGRRRRVTI
uniref:Uncharacterized protein K02A2.6 n=1 Tax=Culex pipiens TaxID=7175 RepID=A0A8D8N962_CULPI